MKFLLSICLVFIFVQPSIQKRSDDVNNHLRIGELLQSDSCPDTLKDVHTRFKLIEVYVGSIVRLCCGCNPGFYLEVPCKLGNHTSTICKPCKPGTYIQDFAHQTTSCAIDSVTSCPPDRVYIPGNQSKPSRCKCPPGYDSTEEDNCQKEDLHVPKIIKIDETTHAMLQSVIHKISTTNKYIDEDSKAVENRHHHPHKDQYHITLDIFILSILFSSVISVLLTWLCTWRYYRSQEQILISKLVAIHNGSITSLHKGSYYSSSSSSTLNSNRTNGRMWNKNFACGAGDVFSNTTRDEAHLLHEETSSCSREDENVIKDPCNKIVINLRNKLASHILNENINPFIRFFFPEGENPEQFIEYIQSNRNEPTSEKFIRAFNKLQEQGIDKFNPKLIYDYFMETHKNNLAELINLEATEWMKQMKLKMNGNEDWIIDLGEPAPLSQCSHNIALMDNKL